MAVTYFKRYRMELRLPATLTELEHPLPETFRLVPWSPKLVNRHAEVKWASFREEIDAHVFPCLGELDGCRQLMREIASRKNFLPQATWLACRQSDFGRGSRAGGLEPIGTVQGLRSSAREGAIQNLGVHPEARDLGVGSALLHQALLGFQEAGCQFVHLEVTVQNTAAIRLYERFGFKHVETLFKIAEVQYA